MNQPYRWLFVAFVVTAGTGAAGAATANVVEPRPVAGTPARAADSVPAGGAPLSPAETRALQAEYADAIRRKVVEQWIRPASVPLGEPCKVYLRLLPGGRAVAANVDPTCPFDEEGRRSVEKAVFDASPLPYHGYESVFTYRITFTFVAEDLEEAADR